ncbi:hypothetical protein ACVBE9_05085 [Eionea flava]
MDNTIATQPASLLSDLSSTITYSLSLTEVQWAEVQWGLAIVCLVGFIAVILLSRIKSTALKKELAKLRKDLQVANSTTIGMGQKLLDIEKQLNTPHNINNHHDKNVSEAAFSKNLSSNNAVLSKTTKVPSKPQSLDRQTDTKTSLSLVSNHTQQQAESLPSDEAYEKSRELLSQGTDIHDVVKQSGLSFSEVALMQKLAHK